MDDNHVLKILILFKQHYYYLNILKIYLINIVYHLITI